MLPGFQRTLRHILYGTGTASGCPFFAIGWLLIGFLVTYLLTVPTKVQQKQKVKPGAIPHDDSHGVPLIALGGYKQFSDDQRVQNVIMNKTIAGEAEELLASIRTADNPDVADLLAKRVRVLCMVLTTEKYHDERAIYVKNTWGGRCTSLVFLSDKENATLPAIKASSQADYGHVWSKVRGGFRWAYDNHLKNFDWFMKADDDTFFFLENLRALLAEYNPNDGIYVGHEFGNPQWKNPRSYYSGGAGYVLSRGALIKLVEEAFSTPKYCSKSKVDGPEDVEMGKCLENVGIATRDTRDDKGRQRFQPLAALDHLTIGYAPSDFWIWTYDKYPYKEGKECCSSLAISFHYITPGDMIVIEYYVYRFHLFGRNVFSEGVAAAHEQAYKLVEEKLNANKYEEADATAKNRLRRDNRKIMYNKGRNDSARRRKTSSPSRAYNTYYFKTSRLIG